MSLNEADLDTATAGRTLIAVLDTCARLGWVALALMLQAAVCVCLTTSWARMAMAVVIVPGLATQYLAARLALDASLFRALYHVDAMPALFDRALGQLLGHNAAAPGSRSMASRWHGTQRLLRWFGMCLAIELIVWLLALALQWMPA